jgi:hypothetical protein
MKELIQRNKLVVQLYKIGWSKYSIAQLFEEKGIIKKWDKFNIYNILSRDFGKYAIPTEQEISIIEQKYKIKLGNKTLKAEPNQINDNNKNNGI